MIGANLKASLLLKKQYRNFIVLRNHDEFASYVICADHAKLHELIIVVFDYSNKPFNV